MKYSKTALMELSHKYTSVLKKCAFLNAAILMGVMVAGSANATEYITRQVNSTNPFTFDDDYFHNSNQTGERGGAIYNTSGNTLNLVRDAFVANSADWGGAIYSGGNAPVRIWGGYYGVYDPTSDFRGTVFNKNIARYQGGAIYSASNVTISGHDGSNFDGATGVLFTDNTADGESNDIYMGGSANTHLYLNLNSQVHTYHYTYPCGDTICDGYRHYKDDITLDGGIDGEYYTINATSQTNLAGGTSTVAMGDVSGAMDVNIGGSTTFGKATANSIDAGNLNLYNTSSLIVGKGITSGYNDVELGGSAYISGDSYLEVAGDLYAGDSVTNHGTTQVGGELYTDNSVANYGSVVVTDDLYAKNNITNQGNIKVGNETAQSDLVTINLTNTNGTTGAVIDVSGDIYAANILGTAGSLVNLKDTNTDGISATIKAAGDISSYAISNTNTGTGNGVATITAGKDVIAGTTLSNTNGSVSADGDVYVKGTLTNALTSNSAGVDSSVSAGEDIQAAVISNTKTGTGNGVATIMADGEIYATKTVGEETTTYTGAQITNTNADLVAGENIYATTIDNTEGLIDSLGGNIVASGAVANTAKSLADSDIIADGSITADSLTNTELGTESASVIAGKDITITTTLSNTKGDIVAGSSTVKGDISVGTVLTNTQGTVTAHGDVAATTSISNTAGVIEAKSHTTGETTVVGDVDTITLSNTDGTVNATGSVFAQNSAVSAGGITNLRASSADDVNATLTAGKDIVAYSLSNADTGAGNGVAAVTAGSSTQKGSIRVGTTLTNTNGTVAAHGGIEALTSITNTNGIIATQAYPDDPEEPFVGAIKTLDLTNTGGIVTAIGRISAVNSDYSDGSITNSGVTAGIASGDIIDTVTLSNTNGSIGALRSIYASDYDSTTGGLTNLRTDDVGAYSATVTAGGDIEAYILSNEKKGTADGSATVSAGGSIYAKKEVAGETTTYTGLTLNNTLGVVQATGDVYAIGGANSGLVKANTLYLQGDTETPRTYLNTGLIDAKVDITDGMILTTDGIDDETTPTKGITGSIKNDGLLKMTSGKVVADVTGIGTLRVDDDNTAEIKAGVTVSQNTVETLTAASTLGNKGTLNVNTLLTNQGEIANTGIVNLNGIGAQTNVGVISGNGTLNIKTIAGTGSAPNKTTTLTNTGLINNSVAVDAASSFVTAAADNAVAASATSGITGAVTNNGALTINNGGYLLADVTGADGMTTVTSGADVVANAGVGITQAVIGIDKTSSLAIDADKIVGKTTNNGSLTLRGGVSAKALAQAINGTGLTKINDGAVSSAFAINQELAVTAGSGLSINADNIGGTVTNGGTLTLTGGTLKRGVNADGTLAGVVTVTGNTTVDSASVYANTLNVNAGKTFKVGENVVQAANADIDGTLDIDITAAGKGESTVAGSNVTINNLDPTGGKLVVHIADSVLDAQHAQTQEVALIHNANKTFEAGQIEIISNGDYSITVDAVNKKYVIVNNDSYADTSAATGGSGNNMNTAVALDNAMGLVDGTAGRAVQKGLNLLSKASPIAYQKALTDLAPTDTATSAGVTQDFNNLVDAQVADRLAEGVSGGDVFERRGVWAQALYNYSKQDSSRKTPGFKGNTVGLALGLDGQLNASTTIGVGYAFGKTDVDSAGRDTDIESHNLFVYGQYQPSKWFVRGMMNYGMADYTEKANILGYTKKAKYDVDNYGARAYVGYNLDNGFTPESGLRYTHIKQDKYTDTLDQTVKTDTVDVLTAVVGVNYATKVETKGFKWTPKAHFDVTYDLLTDRSNATVNVGTSVYNIKGEKLERLGAEAGVAAEMSVNNWDFTLGYDLGIRKDYQSHTGKLKAKYNF